MFHSGRRAHGTLDHLCLVYGTSEFLIDWQISLFKIFQSFLKWDLLKIVYNLRAFHVSHSLYWWHSEYILTRLVTFLRSGLLVEDATMNRPIFASWIYILHLLIIGAFSQPGINCSRTYALRSKSAWNPEILCLCNSYVAVTVARLVGQHLSLPTHHYNNMVH